MIRDLKLAMESCKAVHRAVLHYTFIVSLNYRPFNSGVWHEDKKMMLRFFKDTLPGKHENNYFRYYARLWAHATGQQASTNDDFEQLWDKLDELKSFMNKLANPKAMRWFSINDSCKDQLDEFWPLKMIMRYDMVGVFQGNAPPEEYIDPDILAN